MGLHLDGVNFILGLLGMLINEALSAKSANFFNFALTSHGYVQRFTTWLDLGCEIFPPALA